MSQFQYDRVLCFPSTTSPGASEQMASPGFPNFSRSSKGGSQNRGSGMDMKPLGDAAAFDLDILSSAGKEEYALVDKQPGAKELRQHIHTAGKETLAKVREAFHPQDIADAFMESYTEFAQPLIQESERVLIAPDFDINYTKGSLAVFCRGKTHRLSITKTLRGSQYRHDWR